jgi:DNA modification methylase
MIATRNTIRRSGAVIVSGTIYENVMRKEQQAGEMSERLIENLKEFEREEILNMSSNDWTYSEDETRGDGWTLKLGDSSERLKELDENSVGFCVYSPPFHDLFTYSPSERDLGNARSIDEFFEHYREYIIPEILRAMQPGRNCLVHCENLLASRTHHGYIGMIDFRGDIIRAHQEKGWIYAGETIIQKNPQVQAIRTKNHRLLFKTFNKDSSGSYPGLADYVLYFKKPGENKTPIDTDLTEEDWIRLAHPIIQEYPDGRVLKPTWDHISETDVLNSTKDSKDHKHICPLQLDLLSDLIRLKSNKGELVLDPFNGIGSTGHEAIRLGREYVGIELKPEYYRQAVTHLKNVEYIAEQPDLFSFAGIEV